MGVASCERRAFSVQLRTEHPLRTPRGASRHSSGTGPPMRCHSAGTLKFSPLTGQAPPPAKDWATCQPRTWAGSVCSRPALGSDTQPWTVAGARRSTSRLVTARVANSAHRFRARSRAPAAASSCIGQPVAARSAHCDRESGPALRRAGERMGRRRYWQRLCACQLAGRGNLPYLCGAGHRPRRSRQRPCHSGKAPEALVPMPARWGLRLRPVLVEDLISGGAWPVGNMVEGTKGKERASWA